jgi:hypothetical protein
MHPRGARPVPVTFPRKACKRRSSVRNLCKVPHAIVRQFLQPADARQPPRTAAHPPRTSRTRRTEPAALAAPNLPHSPHRTCRTRRTEPAAPAAPNLPHPPHRTCRTRRTEPAAPDAPNLMHPPHPVHRTAPCEPCEPNEPDAPAERPQTAACAPPRRASVPLHSHPRSTHPALTCRQG